LKRKKKCPPGVISRILKGLERRWGGPKKYKRTAKDLYTPSHAHDWAFKA